MVQEGGMISEEKGLLTGTSDDLKNASCESCQEEAQSGQQRCYGKKVGAQVSNIEKKSTIDYSKSYDFSRED